MGTKVLKGESLLIVSVISPFRGPGDTLVDRNQQPCPRLMIVEGKITGSPDYAVAQGQAGRAHQAQVEVESTVVTVFNKDGPACSEILRNDKENIGVEVRLRILEAG